MLMGWVPKSGQCSYSAISQTYSIEDVPEDWSTDSSGAVPGSMSCKLSVSISVTFFFSFCNELEAHHTEITQKSLPTSFKLGSVIGEYFRQMGERESNEKEEGKNGRI